MNAAKQAAWLFCLMLVLAASGWYFASAPVVVKLDDKALAKTADSIVTGLTVRQFDETGLLTNYLESPEMKHIPNQNANLLKSPHIVMSQKNQSPWDIRAKKAHSINKGEQITFIKEVVIHQDKTEHAQESTLKTEELVYFPKLKFATTDKAVIFKQPGRIMQSMGMNAYLEEKHVKLLGKAQATYEPNNG